MPKIPPGPLTGKQPDGEQIIAEIKKNERESLVVKTSIFNGYPVIHARIRARTKEDKIVFTREGFTLKPGEQIQALITALTEADRQFGDIMPAAPPPPRANGDTFDAEAHYAEHFKAWLANNPGQTIEDLAREEANRDAQGMPPRTWVAYVLKSRRPD